MIRQAISCDLCRSEKRETNHWFVAYEQNGELRVSGWSARNRIHPGMKHLCGQACVHKLVDDFVTRAVSQKAQTAAQTARTAADALTAKSPSRIDASLTSRQAYDELESSVRLVANPGPPAQTAALKPSAELITITGKKWIDSAIPPIEEQRSTAWIRRAKA